MQVRSQADRPDESLGGAAARGPTHRVLVEGEASLLGAIHVQDVVAHLLAGLQEGYSEGCVVRGVLDREISTCVTYTYIITMTLEDLNIIFWFYYSLVRWFFYMRVDYTNAMGSTN